MYKYLSFRNLLVGLFFLLFFTYLREQLIVDALRGLSDTSSTLSPFCVLGMITMIAVYAFSHRKEFLGFGGLLKHYRNILLYTLGISIFWSLLNPFNSMNTYLLITLPTFIVWFSYYILYTEKDVRIILFFLIIGLLVLAKTFFDTIEYRLFLGVRDESAVNTSYYLLYLTPLFLCSKKNIIKISTLIIVLIVVLTSAKRGGTIAITLSILAYIFTNYVLIEKRINMFRNLFIVLLIVFVGGFYLIEYFESTDLAVVSRLIQTAENKGEETRTDIWFKVIEMIFTSNIFQLIFGHGYNSVLVDNPLGFSAHNDFLEILYDFGVVAFVAYVVLYIRLYKFCKELIINKSRYAGAMVFSFCLLIVNSMVSHIYIYSCYASIFALVWGGIYALYKKENNSSFYKCPVKRL